MCGRHKQPGAGEMWLNGRIVSTTTRQPVGTAVSKRLGSELEKLFQLFKSGALSQEEYDQAKKRLIGD